MSLIIIIRIMFFILEDFASSLSSAKSFLIITPKGVDKETNEPITEYQLKEEFEEGDLNYHIQEYIRTSKMSGYLEEYKRYSRLYDPYFHIFTSALYLIGWTFILSKNFPLFMEHTDTSLLLTQLLEFLNNYSTTEEPFSQISLQRKIFKP